MVRSCFTHSCMDCGTIFQKCIDSINRSTLIFIYSKNLWLTPSGALNQLTIDDLKPLPFMDISPQQLLMSQRVWNHFTFAACHLTGIFWNYILSLSKSLVIYGIMIFVLWAAGEWNTMSKSTLISHMSQFDTAILSHSLSCAFNHARNIQAISAEVPSTPIKMRLRPFPHTSGPCQVVLKYGWWR